MRSGRAWLLLRHINLNHSFDYGLMARCKYSKYHIERIEIRDTTCLQSGTGFLPEQLPSL